MVREEGSWRIMGRTSVDILKCGGYKLSALEIEGHLLENDAIGECAVVGVPDEAYGQVVAAVLVGKGGAPPPTLPELRQWARNVLAPYKVRKMDLPLLFYCSLENGAKGSAAAGQQGSAAKRFECKVQSGFQATLRLHRHNLRQGNVSFSAGGLAVSPAPPMFSTDSFGTFCHQC